MEVMCISQVARPTRPRKINYTLNISCRVYLLDDDTYSMLQLHGERAMFGNDELQARTVSSWKKWKVRHHADMIITTTPYQRTPLVHVNPLSRVCIIKLKIIKITVITH